MRKKTRFVKVKLEYVLDVGRDVEVLPFEVLELAQPGAPRRLVLNGLRGVMRNRNRRSVALIVPVHYGFTLWHPTKKAASKRASTASTAKKSRATKSKKKAT